MTERIAVVGAGIAGMTAARDLARDGRGVTVFDKARGVGGRMPTRRHETGAFDHGAQYFTAKGEAFQAQVANWCGRGVAAVWEGALVDLAAGTSRPRPAELPRYVGVPKMSVLARDLGAGLDVRLSEHIDGLVRDGERWTLTTRDGVRHAGFEAVVLSAPAPQTEALLQGLVGAEGWRARIAEVSIDPCWAGLVSFATPVGAGFDGAFVEGSPLSWVARGASKPARPAGECWVLHAGPVWSQEQVDTPPEAVAEALLEAFAKALGRALPERLHLAAHRWLYARTQRPLGEEALWSADLGVGVCGDWLRGARIEDAFESGRALAARIR